MAEFLGTVLMNCLLKSFLALIIVFTLTEAKKCQPLSIARCQNLGYNTTRFPNRFGHENQRKAGIRMNEFRPLIEVECASNTRIFLCSLYAPVCYDNDKILLPCRSLCEETKRGCIALMRKFGYDWPKSLNCSLFPERKDDQTCLAKETTPKLKTTIVQKNVITLTTVKPSNLRLSSSNTAPRFQAVQNTVKLPYLSLPSTTSNNTAPEPNSTAIIHNTVKPSVPNKPSRNRNNSRCEKIRIPMCQNFTYKMTRFPNRLGHRSQEDAALEVHQFWPLVQSQCSSELKKFLCSVYAPACNDESKVLLPCRSLCEETKRGCIALMRKFGYDWPKSLNCSLFPAKKDDQTCLAKATVSTSASTVQTYTTPSLKTTIVQNIITLTTVKPSNLRLSSSNKPSVPNKPSRNRNNLRCEKIRIPMCQNFTYKMTRFPNRFGHRSQEAAALEVYQLWPLVQLQCSSKLKKFLCSLYAPVCNDDGKVLLPCRSLCKRAKRGCRKIMKSFGIKWPRKMKCRRFPNRKNSSSCLRN